MLTLWTAIPIKKRPGIGMCLAMTHADRKSSAEICSRVFLAWPPPGANWSIGNPHLFQNTAGIKDAEKQQHLLTKTTLTHTTVVPVPAPEEAALLGVYQLWAGGGEILNCFRHNLGKHFRSCQHIFSTFQRSFIWLSGSSGTFHARV